MSLNAEGVGLAQGIKERVLASGFHGVGLAPATEADGFHRLVEWVHSGSHAGMAYMERGLMPRRHPDSILPGVKTVIMAAMAYGALSRNHAEYTVGKVARYARGPDYHEVLWERLGQVLNWLEGQSPGLRGRVVADTAPLMERDFARRAGLGWVGRNTMLINPRLGSFTVLGAILVDLALPADPPFEADRCGTCRACIQACPTGALAVNHWLDARKCISYWTIEHRGSGPEWVARQADGWLFGCDICQEVCPWNRRATQFPTVLGNAEEMAAIDPRRILEADDPALRALFRKTALWRARPEGLRRNALWLLGSCGSPGDRDLIERHLAHADAGVSSAAAWALGMLRNNQ